MRRQGGISIRSGPPRNAPTGEWGERGPVKIVVCGRRQFGGAAAHVLGWGAGWGSEGLKGLWEKVSLPSPSFSFPVLLQSKTCLLAGNPKF